MRIAAADLEQTYRYLSGFAPFKDWQLPDAARIDFVVNRSQQMQGEYDVDPHTIKVSSYFCKTWNDVIETVAHEMVHLACEKHGHYSHADHCPQFRRLARSVCRAFGWNVESF